MAKMLDCSVEVNELQLRYSVHFWTNTLECQYPPAEPTLSAFLNHSWPVIHLVFFFSSLAWDISHSFTHTQSTTERVEEKNKRLNTDWGLLQAQEGEVRDTYCALCELTRVCTQAKTLTKPLAMLTLLLAWLNPASVGQHVIAVIFLISVLLSSLSCF